MSHNRDTGAVIQIARSGSVKDAMERYGVRRAKLYEMIKECPTIAKRLGGITLIDYAEVDRYIDSLPTIAEAPCRQKKNLVNLPNGRVSKVVAKARARKAEAAQG